MRRLPLPNYIARTGARFERTSDFIGKCVVVDTTAESVEYSGVPLTMISENHLATSTEEMHCFVIGETGCGKTRRVIMPTIRMAAKSGQSLLISDPKGELYRETADALKKNGYEVYVLNFRTPSKGQRWNPLGVIEKLYRMNDTDSRDKAVLMVKDISDILKQAVHSDKDMFWENAAASVFVGSALTILEYGLPGELTFINITTFARELFCSAAKLGHFLQTLPKGSPITNSLSLLRGLAKDTLSSISGVFEQMMAIYTNQAALQDLFSESEIDIESMGRKPVALFFILPDDSTALYPIATVFVKQIYSTLVNLADANPTGRLVNRVTFLLDEFANFATIPSVDAMLTAARSRGIKFVLVCQSMEQLQSESKYKVTGAEVLMSNCRVWLYMSCRDIPFLERLSKICGEYVSPYTGNSQPLVSVDELQHFEMGQVLIINDRCHALIGRLPDYSKLSFGEVCNKAHLPESREYKKIKIIDANLLLKAVEQSPSPETEQDAPASSMAQSLKSRIEMQLQRREADDLLIPGAMDDFTESRISPFASKPTEEDDSYFDIESLSQRIDAAIAAIEARQAEETQEDTQVESDSEVELFANGRIEEALACCARKLRTSDTPSIDTMTNMAFLLRYSKKNASPDNPEYPYDIETLLQGGIERNDPYARINMALHLLTKKDYPGVCNQLNMISRSEWLFAARGFWYQHLWIERSGDPEGALVCVWASSYAQITFNDYHELLKTAHDFYGADTVKNTLHQDTSEEPKDTPQSIVSTNPAIRSLRAKLAAAIKASKDHQDEDED